MWLIYSLLTFPQSHKVNFPNLIYISMLFSVKTALWLRHGYFRASSSKTPPSFSQREVPTILCTIALRICICIWSVRFWVQPLPRLTAEPLLLSRRGSKHLGVLAILHLTFTQVFFLWIFSLSAIIPGIFKKILHTNYSLVICKNGIYFCYINLEFCDLDVFTYWFQEWLLLLFLTLGFST